jgi:hypothetical protein
VGNTVGDRTFYEAHFHHLLAAKLEACGYGIRRTDHHFEPSSVNRELVEKFSRRTKLVEQRGPDEFLTRTHLGSIRKADQGDRLSRLRWMSNLADNRPKAGRFQC